MIVEGGRSACAASRPTRKELNWEVSIGMSLTFDVTSARALTNPSFPPSTRSNTSCAPQVLLLVTLKYSASRVVASMMTHFGRHAQRTASGECIEARGARPPARCGNSINFSFLE